MKRPSDPRAELFELRELVDSTLCSLLPDPGDPPHRLHAAMRYALLSPGKRLRPTLAILCARHLGCPIELVLRPACALEFVHAASLVFDDLPCMDDADTRRGQPSVHARYGQDVAVLTGIALLNEAFAVLVRTPGLSDSARVAMVDLLSATVGPNGLAAGQEKDLRAEDNPSAAYVSQMHHQKTGVLFVASVEMGGLAAGADAASLDALRRFARELGLAFQALDDMDDEAELAGPRPQSNLLAVLGRDGVRQEAGTRLNNAKAELASGGPKLAAMGGYVDLLLGAMQGSA